MERNGMMETAKRQVYGWWVDSHGDSHGRSQWLHSTLSELDERAKSMLKIIEEDADSFAQLAEMYYKKRPQLVSLVEDFYRAHWSLAIQFDHLRHDPSTRRISPIVRSFSLSTDHSEKGSIDSEELAYDSSESIDSEVDDPLPEASYEIDRLKEESMIQKRQLMEKEREMEEVKRKLYEICNEVMEVKEEAEKLSGKCGDVSH